MERCDDLHAAAAEHAAGRKAPIAQLAQHPPAGLGLKGNALKRVQTRRADVLLLQSLPQRLQRPAAAQITQERTLAQLDGGKARLCAKHDILRQRAVFHHGHFIEAKLHSLALLCFLENFAQRAPALMCPQHRAVLPRGAALSISSAIHAAPARASPHRAAFRFIIPYFPGSAKSPAGAVCISCRKNIHFRQIVRTRSNIVVCSIL